MSGFFAVLLLLLSAVVCQAAPQQNSNSNSEEQDSEKHPDSEPVAPVPKTESLPPGSPSPHYQEKLPTPPRSPVHSPPPSPLRFTPPPSPLPSPLSPPQPLSPLSLSPQPSPLPQSPPPQFQPPPLSPPQSPSPQCPPQVPPCPPECQALPQPVPPPPKPQKKPCWLVNLFNKCVKVVMRSLTDLIVITGEKPAISGNSEISVSFGKKGNASKQPKNGDASASDSDDDVVGDVGCFWYKDLRRPAPRTRIASCVTDPNGHGTQCNFCCVGHKVIDCSNCLTINCNPTINCCSCTINVTVVNKIENTGQQN